MAKLDDKLQQSEKQRKPTCAYCDNTENLRQDGWADIDCPDLICRECFVPTDLGMTFDDLTPADQ